MHVPNRRKAGHSSNASKARAMADGSGGAARLRETTEHSTWLTRLAKQDLKKAHKDFTILARLFGVQPVRFSDVDALSSRVAWVIREAVKLTYVQGTLKNAWNEQVRLNATWPWTGKKFVNMHKLGAAFMVSTEDCQSFQTALESKWDSHKLGYAIEDWRTAYIVLELLLFIVQMPGIQEKNPAEAVAAVTDMINDVLPKLREVVVYQSRVEKGTVEMLTTRGKRTAIQSLSKMVHTIAAVKASYNDAADTKEDPLNSWHVQELLNNMLWARYGNQTPVRELTAAMCAKLDVADTVDQFKGAVEALPPQVVLKAMTETARVRQLVQLCKREKNKKAVYTLLNCLQSTTVFDEASVINMCHIDIGTATEEMLGFMAGCLPAHALDLQAAVQARQNKK